jgi:hypothetical protein
MSALLERLTIARQISEPYIMLAAAFVAVVYITAGA